MREYDRRIYVLIQWAVLPHPRVSYTCHFDDFHAESVWSSVASSCVAVSSWLPARSPFEVPQLHTATAKVQATAYSRNVAWFINTRSASMVQRRMPSQHQWASIILCFVIPVYVQCPHYSRGPHIMHESLPSQGPTGAHWEGMLPNFLRRLFA